MIPDPAVTLVAGGAVGVVRGVNVTTCDRLLAAPPMQVDDWIEMKSEIVETAGRE